jgi:tetratricopeptide (TPR) repeat protein
MKKVIIAVLLIAPVLFAQGQNERKFVRKGNSYFMDGVKDTMKIDTIRFQKAEAEYRKALEKKQQDPKWSFNLGDAQYKQMKFDEAISNFDQIAKQSADSIEKARAFHNIGNSQLFKQKLDESIEAYKEALRNNPNDIETKYNLMYAQRLKQQQQQQQQNKDQNKDNKDQNKEKQDQDKQNQDKQNQDKQNQQDNQQNQQNQNKDQQQKQQQQKNKISKENAEQLLQALQNDEQKIQDKVKKAQVINAKKVKVEKDW